MATPIYERWDIVAVPFPYTEGDRAQRRPALIVSGRALAQRHGLYWVAMITSAENTPWRDDVAIRAGAETGLPIASVVRAAKIATVRGDRIERRLGMLRSHERALVHAALLRYLGGVPTK
ncbi:MAG: type II toxin-antitoxin system PemK/MazF family toxin [Alphaproteobacteria bacterium]|nr:type II toxin-antitoxin system PemK/MazF family toxin [Alphaproteobacteria bacterium]